MSKHSHCSGFTFKALEEAFLMCITGMNDLDGDVTFQPGIIGTVHHRHTACTYFCPYLIPAYFDANQIFH